ncbi:MAG: class I SAM-dependent RNA methyltransferase [Alphaproteobacteria bacterium]|nr:class I SAM-dependent RNA methyltransferase [Alphaproteobacteria bacterium]MCB9791774.1 class I SAM-dependent RNA methyltransferase [Alphaproteobacteria bacterium]
MSAPPALPCPHQAACGGCANMATPLDAQLQAKADTLTRALGRAPDRMLASPRSEGYRARIRLQVGPGGALGYHRPRSHELVEVPDCAIARPELIACLEALRAGPVGPGLQRIELRSDGARVVVNAQSAPKARKQAQRSAAALAWPDVALDGRKLKGRCALTLEVAGVSHRVSPGSFYQVNLEVNALLVAEVGEVLRALKPAALLDLHAGIGNLSLPLAVEGTQVFLVESSPSSAGDAHRKVKALGVPATVLIKAAEKLTPGEVFFDVALLDPPRTGAQAVIPTLLLTRPRAIVYVSCNPHTLARDIRPALASGYALERLVGFDMFPHTPHVEAMALLTRQ